MFLLSYFVDSQFFFVNHLIDDGHFGYNAKLKTEHYWLGLRETKCSLQSSSGLSTGHP
jgi:hypothetical protein